MATWSTDDYWTATCEKDKDKETIETPTCERDKDKETIETPTWERDKETT